MNTHEVFLSALRDNPTDDNIRLIYADYLEENDMLEESKNLRKATWKNCELEHLRGKVINQIRLYGEYIIDFGEVAYYAEGDCCSESWFYSITGVKNLLGEQVIGFCEINTDHVNTDDGLCRQEHDSVYGVGIVTRKGICEVIYRCSSNGYYGGWLQKVNEINGSLSMKNIEEDWKM